MSEVGVERPGQPAPPASLAGKRVNMAFGREPSDAELQAVDAWHQACGAAELQWQRDARDPTIGSAAATQAYNDAMESAWNKLLTESVAAWTVRGEYPCPTCGQWVRKP